MKSDLRYEVTFEAGFGDASQESESLIDLLKEYVDECKHYGIIKRWREGKYEISKYYDGKVVKRYAAIYKTLWKQHTIAVHGGSNSKSMIEKMIEAMADALKPLMDMLSSNSTLDDLYDVLGGISSQSNRLAKKGLLIRNNQSYKPHKMIKRDPFHRVVMKIPR